MKELQASIQSLIQARQDDEHSPLRTRSEQIRLQLQALDDYLLTRSSRLVEPRIWPICSSRCWARTAVCNWLS